MVKARTSPARFLVPGECAACHANLPAYKLGLCPECGGRFCGDHILFHRCPLPLEVY